MYRDTYGSVVEDVFSSEQRGSSGGSTAEAMEVDGNSHHVANGDHAAGTPSYDENLYSRQIYTLGAHGMTRLRQAHVLISGIGAVGVEIAKNLILGGIRHVTIQDHRAATVADLSAQYYLREGDVGQNRADRSHKRLAELNDSVTVASVAGPLTEQLVGRHCLTILTEASWPEQLKVSQWVRAAGRKLIIADAKGLFGRVFVDLGDAHQVDDKNGEQCQEFLIEHVDRETGDVQTLEEVYHGLEDGDYVQFREVHGMTELNGHDKHFKVTVKGPNKFNIGDIKEMSAYTEGGICRLVKVPVTMPFMSLTASCDKPEFIMDWTDPDKPAQLWLGWQALYRFLEDNHGRHPAPHSEEDARQVIGIAARLNAKRQTPLVEKVDEALVSALAKTSAGNLCPIAGFIGGVAAQEGMKAVTSVFTPIKQWFLFSAEECLPPGGVAPEAAAPTGSRYDGQAAVFGRPFQAALGDQRWFIVGSGAIGCELLKYFAMMGVACGQRGELVLTDMDNIEISNLNRQFLFRRDDVGSNKAEVAARSATDFNPHLHIAPMRERVGGDTEHIFTDAFFEGLSGVANALDNVAARAYMDRRCVYYQLPLLESGTLGPKGNVQVVYPKLTESYSDSQDPPEKSIPICTVKNFPNAIEHCIQWARELFEGVFSNPAESANQYLEDARGFNDRLDKMNAAQKCAVLAELKSILIDHRPKDAEACVQWARELWQDSFSNQIRQLLHNFPPDQTTKDGNKFWSAAKRCPHPLEFRAEDPEHLNFVWSAAMLRAQMYNLVPIESKEQVKALVAKTTVKPFAPKDGVRIAVTDAEAADGNINELDADESTVKRLQLELAKLDPRMKPLVPVEFEKDDDTNGHMDFITAGANLRAANYTIQKADKMKTKQIAGKIIPAIATTTAATAGLVALEMYKVVAHRTAGVLPRLDVIRNHFVNLALPLFTSADPIKAPVRKFGDTEWTIWDCIEIQGDIKLQELMNIFEKKYGLEISMLSQGISMLYAFFLPPKKQEEKKNSTIKELVEKVTSKPIPAHMRALVLEVMCNDSSGEDVEVPYIKYLLTA